MSQKDAIVGNGVNVFFFGEFSLLDQLHGEATV